MKQANILKLSQTLTLDSKQAVSSRLPVEFAPVSALPPAERSEPDLSAPYYTRNVGCSRSQAIQVSNARGFRFFVSVTYLGCPRMHLSHVGVSSLVGQTFMARLPEPQKLLHPAYSPLPIVNQSDNPVE